MNTNTNTEKKLIAEGMFKARPVEGGLTTTATGSEQYACRLLLLEGPDAGKHITWWGGFVGNGFQYTTDSLTILGWDGEASLATWKPSKDVMVVIAHEKHPKTGALQARAKYINSLDGSRPSGGGGLEKFKLPPQQAESSSAAIVAKFKALKAAAGGAATSTASTAQVGEFAAAPDDDLPF